MDEWYYADGDFEEELFQDRQADTNNIMVDVDTVTLQPWPEPFPGKMWVDNHQRYTRITDDGLGFELYQDELTEDEPFLVASYKAYADTSQDPNANKDDAHYLKRLDWQEIQAAAADPTEYLRLKGLNEYRGLGIPAELNWEGLDGSAFVLTLLDNSLFAPFDLRYPDNYVIITDNGDQLSQADAKQWFFLDKDGSYRLYLRPCKWRYVATVIAHYLLITLFEAYPVNIPFTRAHFDRPPVFPYFHDVLNAVPFFLHPFFGGLYAADAGVDHQWSASRSARQMAKDILEQQYFTTCESLVFTGYEIPVITLWRYPPDPGDIILGIERVDTASGDVDRVWIKQLLDPFDDYPPVVIGDFIAPTFRVY
jgi:hypothetical protein